MSRSTGSIGIFALACCVGGLGASAQTSLNVVDGQLVGASNVGVGGVPFDVEFLNGSCIALFGGCDDLSDFAFSDAGSADAAAQALLDQVFIDVPEGMFDSLPSLTLGCFAGTSTCSALIPYGFGQGASILVKNATNKATGDDVVSDEANVFASSDFTESPTFTYARFTLVPEPGTGLLLGAGLVLLCGRRRASAAR